MRIDVLAIGSRGDVQPYIALCIGLRDAGHRVRIVTLGGFEDLVQPYGLHHLSIGGRPLDMANTDAGREWVRGRTTAAGFLKGFVRLAGSLIEEGMATYWRDCSDVEAIVVSGMGILLGVHIAERLNVPLIRVQTSPFARTQYDWAGKKNVATTLERRVDCVPTCRVPDGDVEHASAEHKCGTHNCTRVASFAADGTL